MSYARIVEMLTEFELRHGHVITTALHNMEREQRESAAVIATDNPDIARAIIESADIYAAALTAWEALTDTFD